MGLLAPLQLKDCKSSRDRNHERSSTRTYLGYYSLDADENYVADNVIVGTGTNGAPLPAVRICDPHPTDPHQFVTGISASLVVGEATTYHDDSPGQQYASNNGLPCYVWTVEIEFGMFNPLEQSVSGSMIDMPMRYRWEPEDDPQPIFQDLSQDANGNGKPICNSAGDYFNPGIERPYSKRRLTVLRNEAAPNWYAIQQNEYCTNAAPFNGYPKDTVLLKPLRSGVSKFCQVTGLYYQEMEYSFEIRLETWQKYILDAGFKKLTYTEDSEGNTTAKQENILDESMVPVTDQAPLDGNGQPLSQPITPENLVLLQFQLYKQVSFGFLNMDSLLASGVSG